MLFTKVYKEEDVRLRGCSYNVASVYFHLKNKRDYFKSKNNGSCYDLTKHISKNTGMCEKTIKRAIATLRELGLISTTLKGKVNHYSFPILDAIENNTPIEEVIKNTADLSPSNIKEVEQPQPTVDNTAESLKMAKNNEFEIEDNIDEINNKENSENMGQCLGTLDELKAKNQDIEVIMQSWLEDDDNAKMYNRWINALVQYRINKTPENEEMAQGADRKLSELCNILNIQNKKEYIKYVQEDMDYKNTIIEKNQRAA